MSSSNEGYDDTVSVNFTGVAIVKLDRFKKEHLSYTNLRCDTCGEWWLMLNIGGIKKVTCPWCGIELTIKPIADSATLVIPTCEVEN